MILCFKKKSTSCFSLNLEGRQHSHSNARMSLLIWLSFYRCIYLRLKTGATQSTTCWIIAYSHEIRAEV